MSTKQNAVTSPSQNDALVSVIIPAYNHAGYVQKTIESIIEQTYENIELIVVDDGSSDATYAVIQAMEERCAARFKRVVIKTQTNKGTCQTLNRLLFLAKGEYVYLIASDDMAKPHAIQTLHAFLRNNPNYALAVGDNELIDENGQVLYWTEDYTPVRDPAKAAYKTFLDSYKCCRPDIDFSSADFGNYKKLLTGNHIPNGYLLRTAALREIPPFVPEAPLEDYYLMLQLSKKYRFKLFDEVLFSYRQHLRNTSANRKKMLDMTQKTLSYELQLLSSSGCETDFMSYHSDHKVLISALRGRLQTPGEKIRVGFFVVFDSVFPARPLFELMEQDEQFDPFIVVIPDVHRGEANMFSQMYTTYSSLSHEYKKVFMSYDKKTKRFIDYANDVDIACFANPYEDMTHRLYTLSHIGDKALSIYIHYGYSMSVYCMNIAKSPFYNFVWKNYVGCAGNMREFAQCQENSGANTVLGGYCKMDALAKYTETPRTRKKVIIAPHHTISGGPYDLVLSNFLAYSDFFLELPKLYPDMDFVFRPHPLLRVRLNSTPGWGRERTDAYMNEIASIKNMSLSEGGDYLELFCNSDAMIHDCGSFLGEYLFTAKPCCYMLKKGTNIAKQFCTTGKSFLEQHYHAFSKQDICAFIDDVVISGNDPKKNDRITFFEQELKLYYPHVAEFILEDIKHSLAL